MSPAPAMPKRYPLPELSRVVQALFNATGMDK